MQDYAVNAGYRAWGGLKHLEYGNQVQMDTGFNDRLLADSYELKKAGEAAEIMKKSYNYTADGRLSYLQDQLNPIFDRRNIYDFAGRIKQAKTGLEARGGTVTDPQQQRSELPYRQSYQFNEYGNLEQRNNLHWGTEQWYNQNNNLNYTYYNDRIVNPNWLYDKDGRVIQSAAPDDYVSSGYDARGLLTSQTTNYQSIIERFYDGDGREVKRASQNYVEDPATGVGSWRAENPTYYIRSSVLGGEVLNEVDNQGKRVKNYIRAAGALVATQTGDTANPQNQYVYFDHSDASGMSSRSTNANGSAITTEGYDGAPAELDPMGNNAGLFNPYVEVLPPPSEPESPTLLPYNQFEDAMMVDGQRVNCTLDGMPIGCGQALSMLDTGSAIPASLAWAQNLPGFSFQSYGLGIFGVTLPDIITNSSGAIWTQPPGTRADGWRIFQGGTSIFSISWQAQRSQRQTRTEEPTETEPSVLTRPKAKFDLEKYKQCLRDLFRTEKGPDDRLPGNVFAGFFGEARNPFSITLDYSKNKGQIKGDAGRPALGYSPSNFSPIVYIANDLNAIDKFVTGIHEIGNKIYAKYMRTVGIPQPQASERLRAALRKYGGKEFDDDDAGMALEECVFGGRVLRNGTVLK